MQHFLILRFCEVIRFGQGILQEAGRLHHPFTLHIMLPPAQKMHCHDSETEHSEENTLTVNVTRLRKKLAAAGLSDFIRTKVGSGYLIGD